MQHLVNLINPETPWGDQHLISPYNITVETMKFT